MDFSNGVLRRAASRTSSTTTSLTAAIPRTSADPPAERTIPTRPGAPLTSSPPPSQVRGLRTEFRLLQRAPERHLQPALQPQRQRLQRDRRGRPAPLAGQLLRWGRGGQDGIFSSRITDNADIEDHMVTYQILADRRAAKRDDRIRWLIFWEDILRGRTVRGFRLQRHRGRDHRDRSRNRRASRCWGWWRPGAAAPCAERRAQFAPAQNAHGSTAGFFSYNPYNRAA